MKTARLRKILSDMDALANEFYADCDLEKMDKIIRRFAAHENAIKEEIIRLEKSHA